MRRFLRLLLAGGVAVGALAAGPMLSVARADQGAPMPVQVSGMAPMSVVDDPIQTGIRQQLRHLTRAACEMQGLGYQSTSKGELICITFTQTGPQTGIWHKTWTEKTFDEIQAQSAKDTIAINRLEQQIEKQIEQLSAAQDAVVQAKSANVTLQQQKDAQINTRNSIESLRADSLLMKQHFERISKPKCFEVSEHPWWTAHENSVPVQLDDDCPPDKRSERENSQRTKDAFDKASERMRQVANDQLAKQEKQRVLAEQQRDMAEVAKNEAKARGLSERAAEAAERAAEQRADIARQNAADQARVDAQALKDKLTDLGNKTQAAGDAARADSEALGEKLERLIEATKDNKPVEGGSGGTGDGGVAPGGGGQGENNVPGLVGPGRFVPPNLRQWAEPVTCVATAVQTLNRTTCHRGPAITLPLPGGGLELYPFDTCMLSDQTRTNIRNFLIMALAIGTIIVSTRLMFGALGLNMFQSNDDK